MRRTVIDIMDEHGFSTDRSGQGRDTPPHVWLREEGNGTAAVSVEHLAAGRPRLSHPVEVTFLAEDPANPGDWITIATLRFKTLRAFLGALDAGDHVSPLALVVRS